MTDQVKSYADTIKAFCDSGIHNLIDLAVENVYLAGRVDGKQEILEMLEAKNEKTDV